MIWGVPVTTFLNLQQLDKQVTFIGLDASPDMLAQAEQNLAERHFSRPYQLLCQNLEQPFTLNNASVVIVSLILQFLRPLRRESFIRTVIEGLNDTGCLILIEKVINSDNLLNRLFIKYYYEYKKRNGYSELEIAQKREALENVLIPYRLEENLESCDGRGSAPLKFSFAGTTSAGSWRSNNEPCAWVFY